MSEKLKPCPFCGKTDTIGVFSHSQIEDLYESKGLDCFAVCCDAQNGGCGAVGGYEEERDDAIATWNRRAPLYFHVKPEDVTDGWYWVVGKVGLPWIELLGATSIARYNGKGYKLYRVPELPDLEAAE